MALVMRVVLDTAVLVTGLRSRLGASFQVLRLVQHREVTPLVSPPLFLEYEEVLKRDEQREASGFSLEDVDDFLGEVAALAEPVEIHLSWRPQLRDPGDELVLEAAINGRAEALVTYNIRDFRDAAPRFGVRLLRPMELLQEMSS